MGSRNFWNDGNPAWEQKVTEQWAKEQMEEDAYIKKDTGGLKMEYVIQGKAPSLTQVCGGTVMDKLPTANGLYKALIKAGILYWDEVEAFEGVLVLRFKVSEAPDFGTRDDWVPQCCDTNVWAIFSKLDGWEWKDEQGDYRSFESYAEANAYLDEFFKDKA